MKRLLGSTALLGVLISGGLLLRERTAAACAAPVYSSPDRCNCIAKDWGWWLCFTTGDACAVIGQCGDGGPIVPL